ncbi:hypothetical protein [Streptomyces graminilatus]|uniref:hypothetical protein n=1 Tax=Streptomyces graminilatus TaxID=1464070 RepID=UPI0006E20F6F|nr:hypothetical protein [Streptomyces graminilatus]
MSAPDRFVLQVPESWPDADLSGESLTAMRAAALARTDDPRQKATVNDMFRQGRELVRAARSHGALYGAGTVTLFDDGVFMANVMVFAVTAPTGRELNLATLSAQLGGSAAKGKALSNRVVTAVEIPEVGTVARVTAVEEVPLTADVRMRVLTMHTVIPVPATPRNYLLVTCTSPNLPLRTDVYDLFDAITHTFRYVRSVEETAAV